MAANGKISQADELIDLRSQAEMRLKERGSDQMSAYTGYSHQELVHEAEILRIQLEMIKEELRTNRLKTEEDLKCCTACEEINEQIRAEEALRESEEKYRTIVETASEGIWIVDANGRTTFANQRMALMLGYNLREINDKTLYDFLDKEAGELARINLNHRQQGEKNTYEQKYLRKDGSILWAIVSATPIIDKNGNFLASLGMITDITDRKKAEEALRESELFFKETQQAASVGSYRTNFNTGLWESSEVLDRIFGIDKDYHRSVRGWLGIIHPDDREMMNRYLSEEVILKHQDFEKEYRIIRASDGKTRWVMGLGKIAFGIDGNISSMMGTIQDITERKMAEAALRESEARFKQLANAITQLAWIAFADGYIFWYNERWYDYTGTTPQQMEGWGWQSVHDPEVLPGVMESWKTSIETGEPFEMVFPLKGKDGVFREFLTRIIPIRDQQGKVLQWFGTNTDISGLKKAEQELKRAQEKLNIALENGNIGVWEWDFNSDKIVWDTRMDKMFGLQPGSFEGNYQAFEKLINEEDLPHIRKAISQAIEFNTPFETVYRTSSLASGGSKYISAKALVIKNKEGKPLSMTGVCFDVTGMKKGAEQVLFKLNEELLRSNKELEQFAYVSSHDLQEPLRTVSTFTKLLAQRYKHLLDKDGQQFINYILEGSSRMQVLISELLNYSRIGTRGRDFSEVKLDTALQFALENLKISIQERKAVITYDHLPAVSGDELQLIQLFQNLIGNAIKFCNSIPQIHISVTENTDSYLFSIKDNGIGIEKQYSDKVFMIFQRLVPKGKYEGSGIGLALCKRIVERHGGKIYFESEPGKGTTFYFTIPKTWSFEI